MYLNLFLEWVSFICMLNLIVCINILDKPKVEFQLNLKQDLYIVWYVSFCNEFFNSWSIFVHCMNIKNCKYLTYRVNTRCACICIYPSQYVCVNVHIYFVFAFAGIQIYVLSTYIHVIYMYIHVCWHAFGHVYLSWSCRFIFLFLFPQKERLILLLPLLLAGSVEHLLRRTTVEVVHVIHCVK